MISISFRQLSSLDKLAELMHTYQKCNEESTQLFLRSTSTRWKERHCASRSMRVHLAYFRKSKKGCLIRITSNLSSAVCMTTLLISPVNLLNHLHWIVWKCKIAIWSWKPTILYCRPGRLWDLLSPSVTMQLFTSTTACCRFSNEMRECSCESLYPQQQLVTPSRKADSFRVRVATSWRKW